MCTHYICGINECKSFAHAIYMSQEINKILPFFKYEVMSFKKEDYEEWLNQFFTVNKINFWQHHRSPIIWREWLGKGKCKTVDLIGGFSDYLEFCKEVFHVESLWTPKQTEAFSNKILKNANLIPPTDGYCICILGAGHPVTRLLVRELINNATTIFNKKLHILLCDCTCGSDENIHQIAEDFAYLEQQHVVEVVASLSDALKHCQLLVVTKQMDRKQQNILKRYFDFMVDLADIFVKHARQTCRILFTCNYLSCFNASVFLREYVTVTGKQEPPNIAVTTSYKAKECLQFLRQASSLPIEKLFETPVWGFIEENEGLTADYLMTKFIFSKNTLILPEELLGEDLGLAKQNEVTSFPPEFNDETEREETKTEEEESQMDLKKEIMDMLVQTIDADTLGQENVQVTLYLAEFEHKLRNIKEWIQLQKNSIVFLHERDPILSQLTATIDLLKFWYDKSDFRTQTLTMENKIIFAGIPTDGSFGMKPGVVISQPAVLKNGRLVPYSEYTEARNYPKRKFEIACELLDSFGLYWNYNSYESDILLKTLWMQFGDIISQQYNRKTKQEIQVEHTSNLKSRIRACLREQKQILKELDKVTKQKEEVRKINEEGIKVIYEKQSQEMKNEEEFHESSGEEQVEIETDKTVSASASLSHLLTENNSANEGGILNEEETVISESGTRNGSDKMNEDVE